MTDREKQKKDVRSRPFVFRIANEEADKLVAVAAALGLTPGQMARGIIEREIGLVARIARVKRRVANAELLRQALGEMGRIGNNINQVAAHLNAKNPAPWRRDELERMQLELQAALAEVMAALGRGRP
ncbi:plasmid mobilization relaxosome protein MobC [Bosea sp. BH3]|uniref:plasmid mobilization relaxosome protein MobC n=1 Tax=Bosea sp. BH3 TaxID=2871701 RepID=UPI0021CAE6B7|nr:plasmid mobilization relaxosome protein MobC [Bosea sp. BH3]MCU4178620.1 plasmid mobilization relaxosome protein MobC [Bosea sp. BH3]